MHFEIKDNKDTNKNCICRLRETFILQGKCHSNKPRIGLGLAGLCGGLCEASLAYPRPMRGLGLAAMRGHLKE
ncbi:hypothetical protein GJ496_003877 [Pomphorhynchus laevis]|nr:hypothetical protein GJ496_003877 [Pomphorhynchus laevis]